MKHGKGPTCLSCEMRLQKGHSKIIAFFHAVKAKYPDVHTSWVFRGQKEQDDAFIQGASKLRYPQSAHNKIPARALDIFQINDKGIAVFDPIFMAKIYREFGQGFRWGGMFKTLGDSGHFELIDKDPNKPGAA